MTKQDTPPMSVVMSAFETFLESALGQAILASEREQIAEVLPQLVGYNCLQLSVQRAATLCDGSRFGHLIKMGYAPSMSGQQQDSIWADYEALPVASDCVDIALLHHVLEFAAQPHQLLREATRTLTAGGHLLIVGFNPFSAWPLCQRYYQWRHLPQAAAAFAPRPRVMHRISGKHDEPRAAGLAPIRQGRLAEWLSVLNFDVLQQNKFFLRPPVNSVRWLNKLAVLERCSAYPGFSLGMVYLTLARKRTLSLSPVAPRWRQSMRPAHSARAHSQTLHSVLAQQLPQRKVDTNQHTIR